MNNNWSLSMQIGLQFKNKQNKEKKTRKPAKNISS